MAESAGTAAPASASDRPAKVKRQTAQEVAWLKTAAAALFVHDPTMETLEDLAAHSSLQAGLDLLPAGTLQRWALEGDWHGQRNRRAQHMRQRLQSLVGDAHLERQRKHIEQMSNIYNLTGKHLATLRPKSFEQMMQTRIRALELVHAWENDLEKANIEKITPQSGQNDEPQQASIIDNMSDKEVRKIFEVALLSERENTP